MLDPAPSSPVVRGRPAFGTYVGTCERTELELGSRGVSRLGRLLGEKGWQWFAVADSSLAVGGAIVDAGVFATAFCWLVDRASGRLVADESRLLPGLAVSLAGTPTRGQIARVRSLRSNEPLTVDRVDDAVAVTGRLGSLELDCRIHAEPERAITAVCPVAGGHPAAVNVTQKEVSLSASGTVSIDGRRHELTEAVGLLDHTHGLLARETNWRWAMGVGEVDGNLVGFNLVSGFNDDLENVRWFGDERRALGRVTHDYPADPGSATVTAGGTSTDTADGTSADEWRVRSDDGTTDLRLDVAAERAERTDVGLIASSYRQPVGTWSGRLDGRAIDDCVGVAEIHHARW